MPFRIAALAMLLLWGVGTVFFEAPGVIHLLLSGGVALWVYGTVRPKPADKP